MALNDFMFWNSSPAYFPLLECELDLVKHIKSNGVSLLRSGSEKIVTTLSFSLRTLWRKLLHCEHPYGEIHVTRNKHLVPRTSWKWSLPGSRSELRSRSSLTGAWNIWRPGWCFDSSFRKDLGSEDPAEPHQSPTHTLWDNKCCCFKPVSFEVYRTVYSLHRSR